MAQNDTIDKIVATYFACVTAEPFEYKGERYEPKRLTVSPFLFQGFTCPAMCGGCCQKFTLDYLPIETLPDMTLMQEGRFVERDVMFNGRAIPILSDVQADNYGTRCRNMSKEDGRCGIHGKHPFSCDFELIRFIKYSSRYDPNRLQSRLYGRGWSMYRVDGGRGALCEAIPANPETCADVVRKLKRLREWCVWFNLAHKMDEIIAWAETGPHSSPLYLQ
jgi:Fe-S-cluster containining protein